MTVCLLFMSDENEASSSSPLYALILTPTRELAIQTRDHIQAVTKHTDITVCLPDLCTLFWDDV